MDSPSPEELDRWEEDAKAAEFGPWVTDARHVANANPLNFRRLIARVRELEKAQGEGVGMQATINRLRAERDAYKSDLSEARADFRERGWHD